VGDSFAISKSSGHEIFKWVTSAFAALMPRYVKWPADNACCGGRGINKLPGVVGVIDECRIPLKLPVRQQTGHRQYSALALQVVCDERSRFLDVHIDVPDMQCILLKSELFERLIDREIEIMLDGKRVKCASRTVRRKSTQILLNNYVYIFMIKLGIFLLCLSCNLQFSLHTRTSTT